MKQLSIILSFILIIISSCGNGDGGKDNQKNKPPTVTLSLSNNRVEGGGQIVCTANASDPDGDALTYLWSSSAGTFDNTTSSTAIWTAPLMGGFNWIKITVSDSKAQAEAQETVEVIYYIWPLKVGNAWSYRSENLAGGTHTRTITGTTIINNTEVFVVNYDRVDYPNEKWEEYYLNKWDGCWFYGDSDPTREEPGLMFKFPGNVGDKYWYGQHTYEIIATDAVVNVLGVDFTCYHYKKRYLDFDSEYDDMYFAPNIGLVLVDRYLTGRYLGSYYITGYIVNN